MGNHISHTGSGLGKVLLPDGSTHEFNDTVTVAELMLDYPQRVVVEYQSPSPSKDGSGRPRLTPLPADKKLELGKLYLMLPYKPGRPVSLSSKESHHLLTRANDILKARAVLSSSKLFPYFSKIMCPVVSSSSGTIENNGHHHHHHHHQVDEVRKTGHFDREEDMDDDGMKEDYSQLSRQVSGKSGTWKPSLDTIKEKKDEQRRSTMGMESHWVIVASKVVKRIEKGGLVWA